MKRARLIRAAMTVLLAAMLLAGCTTPTPAPSASPTARATASPSPSPSATPTPKRTSVDLGVPAGDVYNVSAGALDAERGLVYAVANEGDVRTDAGVLAVIDLAAHQVRATVPVPITVDWMSSAALSADGTRLYVAGRTSDEREIAVVVATGVGGRPLGEVLGTVADVRALALDAAGGHLYVADQERLRRLDAMSLEQRAATDLPDALAPTILLAVNPRAGRVYVCDSGGNAIFVYRADDLAYIGMVEPGAQVYGLVSSPTAPEVYATVQAFTRQQPVGRVAVIRDERIVRQWDIGEPHPPTGRVVLDDEGQVFLLRDGVQDDVYGSRILALDADTGAVLKSLALPYANLVYSRPLVYKGTLLRLADVLLTVDLTSGEIGEPLHLGVNVVQMVRDESAGLLFALDSTGVLHVVDTAAMTRVHAWQVLDTGLEPLQGGQITLYGGRLYVADVRTDRTLVLDAATGEKVAEIPKAGQVSVDKPRNRLFVTNQGVFIADMATHQIIGSIDGTVRQERQLYSPGAVEAVYDAAQDWLLVTMTNNAAGSGARTWLDIYDAKTLTRLDTPIQSPQRFVDGLVLDEQAGRIWLASSYPRATLSAWAPDGRLLGQVQGLGGRLFLDTTRGRLYARAWGGLAAVDA
ncbi:MAG: YncE family protein, partial [Anaerolineae bacterium]